MQNAEEFFMLMLTQQNRQEYADKIIKMLDEYLYRHKRYHIHFALALCYCTNSASALAEIIDIKRKTDRFLPLEQNLCSIVFDCISHDSSQRAVQNLETQLQEVCLDTNYFLHTFNTLEYENSTKMIDALFDALDQFLYRLKLQEI